MSPLFFYNTLHRKKELFMPIHPGEVRMYSCGPTVYSTAHIGNLRAYIFNDVLKRVISASHLKVVHAMNITDVGHLVGDEDGGEDKMEVGAKAEGKHPLEIARKYEDLFWNDFTAVGCIKPTVVIRATEAIDAQIELIKQLELKGFTYQTEQAIYFDTSRLKDYGKLTGQDLADKQVGARQEVVVDSDKKHPSDFALWFFLTGRYAHHILQWESPWGKGFPGWHLECSAISREALGQPFDIHTGGVDHIGTHHTNEIAQSEAAYGEPLAHVWMHNEHLLVDNQKMSKSLGNLYTLKDLESNGFSALDFRYLCLMAHYRSKMNFTWEALKSAAVTRAKIVAMIDMAILLEDKAKTEQRVKVAQETDAYEQILTALKDDLDTPKALALLFEANDPYLWLAFNSIFDLGYETKIVPAEDLELFNLYKAARAKEDYARSDEKRVELNNHGWQVSDSKEGSFIYRSL